MERAITSQSLSGPHRGRIRLMLLTLAIALLVLAIKLMAWRITGSYALMSDALESIVNVLTASFGLFSIWLATRPPDDSHPYGHGKIEFLASGLQGALILVAAAGIVREAWPALFAPPPLHQLDLGILLSTIAGAINGSLGWFLIVRGRVTSSATMVGEGKHLLTDTLSTVGVLVGLIAAKATGLAQLDPIAALAVAATIVWTGVGLLRGSADRLMDRAEPAVLEQIATVLRTKRRPEWIEAHQLRAWSSGPLLHVDLHLTLPRYWDLEAAHQVQRQMSSTIREELARPLELMVHTDPCRPEQCVICRVDECPVRAAEFQREPSWDTSMLTGGPSGRAADPVSRW